MLFGYNPPFLFWKNSLKNAKFSGIFLALKELLMATSCGIRGLSSRKYVTEQGMTIPSLSETLGLLW